MHLSTILYTLFATTSLALPPGNVRYTQTDDELAFATKLESDPSLAGKVANITSYKDGYIVALQEFSRPKPPSVPLASRNPLRCDTYNINCEPLDVRVPSHLCARLEEFLADAPPGSSTDIGLCAYEPLTLQSCCVTWNWDIGHVPYANLVAAIRETRQSCLWFQDFVGGIVGGYAEYVELVPGNCVRQCLSGQVEGHAVC